MLNNLFYVCNEAAISLDVYTWFHTLLALYRELSTEMKEVEIKESEEKISWINPMVSKSLSNKYRAGRTEINQELYQLLHQFELTLRDVMKRSGLLIKMQDDPSRALR